MVSQKNVVYALEHLEGNALNLTWGGPFCFFSNLPFYGFDIQALGKRVLTNFRATTNKPFHREQAAVVRKFLAPSLTRVGYAHTLKDNSELASVSGHPNKMRWTFFGSRSSASGSMGLTSESHQQYCEGWP